MTPEMALLLNCITGLIIAFGVVGMVYAIISLWEEYWSNKDDVERYKKYIAQNISERIEEEKKHHE